MLFSGDKTVQLRGLCFRSSVELPPKGYRGNFQHIARLLTLSAPSYPLKVSETNNHVLADLGGTAPSEDQHFLDLERFFLEILTKSYIGTPAPQPENPGSAPAVVLRVKKDSCFSNLFPMSGKCQTILWHLLFQPVL